MDSRFGSFERQGMMNDFLIAMEIYFMGFVIAVIMAALIKGMLVVIRRFSPAEKAVAEKGGEGNA